MEIALGRLKWTEREYFTCSPEGFYYACKGYFDEMEHIESWHRRAAVLTMRVWGVKAPVRQMWAMKRDVDDEKFVATEEQWEQIRKLRKIAKIA